MIKSAGQVDLERTLSTTRREYIPCAACGGAVFSFADELVDQLARLEANVGMQGCRGQHRCVTSREKGASRVHEHVARVGGSRGAGTPAKYAGVLCLTWSGEASGFALQAAANKSCG